MERLIFTGKRGCKRVKNLGLAAPIAIEFFPTDGNDPQPQLGQGSTIFLEMDQ